MIVQNTDIPTPILGTEETRAYILPRKKTGKVSLCN